MARTVRLRVNRALRHVSSGNASIPYLKGRVAKAFNAMMCGSSGDGVVAGSFRFPASPIDVGLRYVCNTRVGVWHVLHRHLSVFARACVCRVWPVQKEAVILWSFIAGPWSETVAQLAAGLTVDISRPAIVSSAGANHVCRIHGAVRSCGR